MSFKVINELPQHTNLDSIKRSLLWCETGFRGRGDTIIENCRFFGCLTKDVYDILMMDNIDDFFCLVEKSRAIRYLSLAYKYMSKEDCAKALINVWERVDNVNSHHEWALMDYVQKGMVAGCECIEDEKGEKHLIFCVGVDLDDYHPEEAIKSVRPNEDDTSTGKDDHDSEEGEVNPDAEQGTENPIWDEPAKDGLEALFGSDDQPEGQTEGESAEKKPVEPENKDSGKENKASKRKSKK